MADDMTTRLAEITANLDNYIEARAWEIAAPRIAAAEARAEQQVAELKDEHARTQQRSADLEKELRRQIKALDGHMNQCPEVARKRAAWRGGQHV
ncbi:hypothetical protein ACFY4C_20490 [Actinomadura viridis]|uniref:hypothetical protein n=1 Tax=Actinomadura viridis TaxID=58110 RepID=UPI00369FDCB5